MPSALTPAISVASQRPWSQVLDEFTDDLVRQVADLYVRHLSAIGWEYPHDAMFTLTNSTEADLAEAFPALLEACHRSKDVYRQAVLRTLPTWVPKDDLWLYMRPDEAWAETLKFFLEGLEDAEWPAPAADLADLDEEDGLDGRVPPAPVAERPFRQGDRVWSSRWGAGLVVTSEVMPADEKVEVVFQDPQVGRRLLLRSLANLEFLVQDEASRREEMRAQKRATDAAEAALTVLSRWLTADDVFTESPASGDFGSVRSGFERYFVHVACVSHADGTDHSVEGPTTAAARLYLTKRLATTWLAAELRAHGYLVSHLLGCGDMDTFETEGPCESIVAVPNTESGRWSPNADPAWELIIDLPGDGEAVETGVSSVDPYDRVVWPSGLICDLISAGSHPAGWHRCAPVCGLARRLILSPSSPADWAMVAEAMDVDLVPAERIGDFEWDEEQDEEREEEGGTFGAFPYTPGS